MTECINGLIYMVGVYFSTLGSMAFMGTTVLCYLLGAYIIFKVINNLFSLISRDKFEFGYTKVKTGVKRK